MDFNFGVYVDRSKNSEVLDTKFSFDYNSIGLKFYKQIDKPELAH